MDASSTPRTEDTAARADDGAPAASIGVLAVGRPTFDLELGRQQVAAALDVLRAMVPTVSGDGDVVTELTDVDRAISRAAPAGAEALVVLGATFCDARMDDRIATRTGLPIVHWSFPEPRTGGRLRLNSFCGAQLAAHTLRRHDRRCAFVHVEPGAADAPERVRAALHEAIHDQSADHTFAAPLETTATPEVVERAGAVVEAMRGRRIGVFGDPPDGFDPCAFTPAALENTTGLVAERVPIDDLFERAGEVPVSVMARQRDELVDAAPLVPGLAPDDVEPSARLLAAMGDRVHEREWSAVATRCWPECLTDYGGAVCAAHGLLADRGTPAACEADLYGAATLLLLQEVSGSVPLLADIVDLADDGTSVLWHCGVAAPSLADPEHPARGASHPNRGIPLVFDFALRPGRVTVARLSRSSAGDALLVGTGELLAGDRPFVGTSGVVRWDATADEVRRILFGEGIEHHVAVVHGDHDDVLAEVARRWALPVLRLTERRAVHAGGAGTA